MINWKYELDVKNEWHATKAHEMSLSAFASFAANQIKALPVFGADRGIEEIVEELEAISADPDPDVEVFDNCWERLYVWADQVVGSWNDKMCWIKTF